MAEPCATTRSSSKRLPRRGLRPARHRVQGTAVFLVSEAGFTPNALMHNLKHNKVLHETNLFVHVQHHEVPWIGFDKRCEIRPLGRLLADHAALRLQERPRRARALGCCADAACSSTRWTRATSCRATS